MLLKIKIQNVILISAIPPNVVAPLQIIPLRLQNFVSLAISFRFSTTNWISELFYQPSISSNAISPNGIWPNQMWAGGTLFKKVFYQSQKMLVKHPMQAKPMLPNAIITYAFLQMQFHQMPLKWHWNAIEMPIKWN